MLDSNMKAINKRFAAIIQTSFISEMYRKLHFGAEQDEMRLLYK